MENDENGDERPPSKSPRNSVTIEITKAASETIEEEEPEREEEEEEVEKENEEEAQDTIAEEILSIKNESQTDIESDQSSSRNNSATLSTTSAKRKTFLPKLKHNKLKPLISINESGVQQDSSSNNNSDNNLSNNNDDSGSNKSSKKSKFYKKTKKSAKSVKSTDTVKKSEPNIIDKKSDESSSSANVKRIRKTAAAVAEEKKTNNATSAGTTANHSVTSNGNGSAKPKPSKIIFAVSDKPGESIIPIESNNSTKNSISERGNDFSNHSKIHFEVMWKDLIYYHASVIKARKKTKPDPETTKKKPAKSTASSAASKKSKNSVESSSNNNNNNRKPELLPRSKGGPTLANISGSFCSGQLTAIMGPSGAGKTVLLNCIAGFLPINSVKENSGEILINGVQSIRVGFVEQFDHLLPNLTVRETLHFASRIRNASRFYLNHDKIVKNIMKQLDLKDISEIFASHCSNGQRKRLSIAIEMVFNSDILILDEPTTGLDSVTGFQIVKTLQNLAKRRSGISIVTTIHQPSSSMFELFDNLIVLSCEGTIIYQGSPGELPNTLQLVGLECPKYYNLSDYLLEVASGDFGRQSLHLLTHYNKEYNRNKANDDWNELEMCSLNEAVRKANKVNRRSFMICTWLLLVRTILCNYRNSFINYTRVAAGFMISILLSLMFTDVVGSISSCPPSKYFLWKISMSNLYETFESQQLHLRENLSVVFMAVLMSFFNSLLKIIVTFPAEVFVFRRENNNFSYHTMSYFIAIILGDIPFDLPITSFFVVIVHRFTGQIFDRWDRLLFVILPCCLTTVIGQLIGMIMSVVFYQNAIAAIYSINMIIIPMILFSGFFKLISEMSDLMSTLSNISFMKSAVNAIVISVYGLGRCQTERLEDEADFIRRNNTEMISQPRWIGSLTSLIDYQLMMTTNQNPSILRIKNSSLEKEQKLTMYMGLDSSKENQDIPLVLQHFALDADYAAYWNEVGNMFKYIGMYLVILYIAISIKIRRQRN